MNLPENVILLDSLGDIQPDNTRPILVCASHCGDNGTFARKLGKCGVKAVFLNNAGIGKNQAGINGLPHYEAANILACAVGHNSAEIGVSRDTWESGIVSHTNVIAQKAGIRVGDSVQKAVALIINRIDALSWIQTDKSVASSPVEEQHDGGVEAPKRLTLQLDGMPFTVANSITFLDENNRGDILVCGSHGGASAGHYAQKLGLKAVFFNDAGVGKNNAGIKSLDSLSNIGISACTVDCMSAEIFNGADMLENGIISVCNQPAKSIGIIEKMTIKEALGLLASLHS